MAMKDDCCQSAAVEDQSSSAPPDQDRCSIPPGLFDTAASAVLGGDFLVTFAPRGGYTAGGLGSDILQRAQNLPEGCRRIIKENPDDQYVLFYDQTLPGINALSTTNAVLSQMEAAANAFTGLFQLFPFSEEISSEYITAPEDDFIDSLRIAVAREVVFLFESPTGAAETREGYQFNRVYRACQRYLKASELKTEPARPRASLDALLDRSVTNVVEAPPVITAPGDHVLEVFSQEGVDVGGRVIVRVPGELPYIRPSGWMGDGRTIWRPGEGEFPFSASHRGEEDAFRSQGRIFRRHLGEFIEGSVAEETDYVLTASRAIQAFISRGWPWIEGLSGRGDNPFVRGPARPIGQRYERATAIPSQITGIDIEDLVGPWTFVGALRAYVTSRGKPPSPSTSFRDLRRSALSLAITQQDFADNDILRAARRRLVGFLGPRVTMAPEVLRMCGFKVDPVLGRPLERTLRSDPALILQLLDRDLEHLGKLRAYDRDVAERGKDQIDLLRIDHAMKRSVRDCLRPRAGPSFGDRLRADLKLSLARHEAAMRDRGAELIYVAKGDEGYAAGELVRVPYQLGWLPGGLFALPDDAATNAFDVAARLAARALGLEPFIDLAVNDRRNDDGDSLLAADDLAEDEVLFSEFSFHTGSKEFHRRSAVLEANGVRDLVAPTWRKIDTRSGYGVDRFSPFIADTKSPISLPDWCAEIKVDAPDITQWRRERSDHVKPDLAWTGWGISRPEDEISEAELLAIAQGFYGSS